MLRDRETGRLLSRDGGEEIFTLFRHKSTPSGVLAVTNVDAVNESVVGMSLGEERLDLETVFRAQYERIARVIAGVTRNPARAEELAVDVFLKWERTPEAHGENAEGWLYRTAVRVALNELRRKSLRTRYARVVGLVMYGKRGPAPDEIFTAQEEEQRVRAVLGALEPREAELLLLRGNDFTYQELAVALNLNPASVGTLLSRALQAFRKEFVRRYGHE
jgi:RNA polymerase sigma-70 factor (ECF subfamily)